MAVRTISTRLAIEGEAEYKASISRINSELKNLQSALKLTESDFKGQANSIDALKTKGDALNRLHEQQAKKVTELQKALDNAQKSVTTYAQKKEVLTKKISENEKALEKLKQSTGDTTEEQAKLTAENEKLNAELTLNEKYLDAAEKGMNGWETQLNNAQVELNDLNGEIKEIDKYLDEAKQSTDGCATSIDKFGDKVNKSSDAADALTNALAAAGIIAALKATAEALKDCVEASIEFESAMAGVAKTTDMSGTELDAMGESIKGLATKIPATATEIANVTEAAGQLGIKKEDLLAFSEVMVNLGVATNLSSTEAATALAKFANVVGMSADHYENLGSVIVALGNSFATTEADIVSMATRLASTGNLVGLSEAEIMAVATALSSLGIEAEAGGSAISKLLKQFEVMVATGAPELADFAKVAGMTSQEFSKAWGNNAVEALGMFIDGLGRVDKAGGSSVATLNDLGITETRLSNAVLAMASSEGILSDAIGLANTSWDENTALAKEAETRYSTTESKLQLLRNAFDNVKIAVGDQLTPALGNLSEVGADVLNWLADFVEDNDALVPILTAVVTTLGVFAGGLVAYTVVTKLAGAATAAFNLILNSNSIFLIATAIAAVVSGIAVLVAAFQNDAIPSVKELTEATRAMDEAFEKAEAKYEETSTATLAAYDVANKYITKLEELEAAGLGTAEAQREYHTTLALLCQVVPELAQYINLETDEIKGGTEALRANTEAWKDNAIAQAMQEQVTEKYAAYAEALIEAEENTINLAKAQENLQTAQDNTAAAHERMGQLWDEASAKAQAQWEEFGIAADATSYLTQEYYDLQNSLYSFIDAEWVAQQTVNSYQEAVDISTEALSKHEAEIDLVDEAYRNLAASQEENTTAAQQNAEVQAAATQVAQGMKEEITALAESYKAAYESATESLEGQFSLWEKVGEVTATTHQTMQEGLASQQAYWDDYGTNLDSLLSRGIEGIDEFAKNFVDGSTESAASLAGFAQMSDEEIMGLMESMSAIQTKREEIAGDIVGITADLEGGLSTLIETYITGIQDMTGQAGTPDFSAFVTAVETTFGEVGVKFEAIGGDAGSGLADGIEASRGGVETASTGMGQGLIDAMRAVLDSHSPSQVMVDIGGDVIEGLVKGIESGKGDLVSAFEELGDEIVRISEDSARNLVERYIQEFSQISERNRLEMDTLKRTITDSMSSMPGKMSSIGTQIVDGMISGLNSRSGALYSKVRSIVNSAISAARRAADTASPSKKTTKIFEDVGEGMVVGLEHKRQKVAEAAQSVVDNALTLDTSKLGETINNTMQGITDAVLMFDASQIDTILRSINNSVPDLSAPEPTTTEQIEKTIIQFGDINVEVTMPGLDEEQAESVGATIGEEIKRELRYKGVL